MECGLFNHTQRLELHPGSEKATIKICTTSGNTLLARYKINIISLPWESPFAVSPAKLLSAESPTSPDEVHKMD